jgi:hypothetical protein
VWGRANEGGGGREYGLKGGSFGGTVATDAGDLTATTLHVGDHRHRPGGLDGCARKAAGLANRDDVREVEPIG